MIWLRTALFWVITQRVMVIPYRRFGTTCLLQLKGQESKKKAGFLLGFFTPEDGTDRLSRNVGEELPLLAAE
jgi:hypothetical protein